MERLKELPPTQDHVFLKGIVGGIAIARNGSLALVLEVGALDLTLLDPDQQHAKILQLEDLWRSLRFESQVVISTKRQDIRTYLSYLENCLAEREGELEGADAQRREVLEHHVDLLYRQMAHLEELAEGVNALVRSYHWVIPYNPFLAELERRAKGRQVLTVERFREAQTVLQERGQKVVRGLGRIGLSARAENDQGIIEEILRFYFPSVPEEGRGLDLEPSPLVEFSPRR